METFKKLISLILLNIIFAAFAQNADYFSASTCSTKYCGLCPYRGYTLHGSTGGQGQRLMTMSYGKALSYEIASDPRAI